MARDRDGLTGLLDDVRKSIHEAVFRREEAPDEEIGRRISFFGTIKRLIARRDDED